MSKNNNAVVIKEGKASRKFYEGMKPKDFKTQDQWIEEFKRIRQESGLELAEMVKSTKGSIQMVLRIAHILLSKPDCTPAESIKASQLIVRATSQLNQCIYSLWRMSNEMGVKPAEEPPLNLPPDFSDPPAE